MFNVPGLIFNCYFSDILCKDLRVVLEVIIEVCIKRKLTRKFVEIDKGVYLWYLNIVRVENMREYKSMCFHIES